MKEPYGEGEASHSGPESCGCSREGMAEALTGVRVGRVLSLEKPFTTGAPTQSFGVEGNTWSTVNARCFRGPTWSETPGMRGNSLRGNREILWPTVEMGATARAGNPCGLASDVRPEEVGWVRSTVEALEQTRGEPRPRRGWRKGTQPRGFEADLTGLGLSAGSSCPRDQPRYGRALPLWQLTSAPICPLRHYPRQEPCEVVPHAGIRAGGAG